VGALPERSRRSQTRCRALCPEGRPDRRSCSTRAGFSVAACVAARKRITTRCSGLAIKSDGVGRGWSRAADRYRSADKSKNHHHAKRQQAKSLGDSLGVPARCRDWYRGIRDMGRTVWPPEAECRVRHVVPICSSGLPDTRLAPDVCAAVLRGRAKVQRQPRKVRGGVSPERAICGGARRTNRCNGLAMKPSGVDNPAAASH
jgi:hypothetical protein